MPPKINLVMTSTRRNKIKLWLKYIEATATLIESLDGKDQINEDKLNAQHKDKPADKSNTWEA